MTEYVEVLLHAFFGVLSGFLFVWALVELLNLSEKNIERAKWSTTLAVISAYLGEIFGLSYYLEDYSADKQVIINGPWWWTHSFFMETKEHFAIMGLYMMIIVLLLVWRVDLLANPKAKTFTIGLLIIFILGVLLLEGAGALIATGVRMGLGSPT